MPVKPKKLTCSTGGTALWNYSLVTDCMKLGLEWKNVKATLATPDQRGTDRRKLNEREPSTVLHDLSKLRIREGDKSSQECEL